MTIEEFAHRCLLIKAGNTTLSIPCCANCEHYKPDEGIIYKNGKVIKKVTLSSWWSCYHPGLNEEDILYTKPEDFCSRFEERNN